MATAAWIPYASATEGTRVRSSGLLKAVARNRVCKSVILAACCEAAQACVRVLRKVRLRSRRMVCQTFKDVASERFVPQRTECEKSCD